MIMMMMREINIIQNPHKIVIDFLWMNDSFVYVCVTLTLILISVRKFSVSIFLAGFIMPSSPQHTHKKWFQAIIREIILFWWLWRFYVFLRWKCAIFSVKLMMENLITEETGKEIKFYCSKLFLFSFAISVQHLQLVSILRYFSQFFNFIHTQEWNFY